MHTSRHTHQWASGPSTHNKTFASTLQDHDSLFHAYEHLTGVPDSNEGLTRLRRIASLVKPIMRKRGWQVQVLTEFMPETPNLLGLNINRGYKICVRLRYSHNPASLIPFEETVDTMLHELSHIVWGPHDANFHALWDELRDEYETLIMKGYSGQGFMSRGNRLGGSRIPPQSEIRQLARANAEKRRVLQKSSGQRVGGNTHRGTDIRKVIADAAIRRNKMDRGCASGTADAGRLADQASQKTFTTKAEEDDANNRAIAEALLDLMEEEEAKKMFGTFTSAPPIAGGLAWSPERGLYSGDTASTKLPSTEEEQMEWALQESMKASGAQTLSPPAEIQSGWTRNVALADSKSGKRAPKRPKLDLPTSNILRFRDPDSLQDSSTRSVGSKITTIDLTGQPVAKYLPATDSWTCEVCTCMNPLQYLTCDACAIERPQSVTNPLSKVQRKAVGSKPSRTENQGWYCRECATLMDHKWWTCSGCGLMKDTS